MMKKLIAILVLMSLCPSLPAQEKDLSVMLQQRSSFYSSSSFVFDYFDLCASGSIGSHVSFNYLQGLNCIGTDKSFFDAANWACASWTSGHYNFIFGKQMTEYAGNEYYHRPIDLFFNAEYWRNYPAFQSGITGQYILSSGDVLAIQLLQSPYRKLAVDHNLFSYSASVRGDHDGWGYSASVNFFEHPWSESSLMAHQVISGWLKAGPALLECDLINRCGTESPALLNDWSTVVNLDVAASDALHFFAKYTRDANGDCTHDIMVHPGTDISNVGAGLYWYPSSESGNVRLHSWFSRSFGVNTNPAGAIRPDTSVFCVGATWFIHLLR